MKIPIKFRLHGQEIQVDYSDSIIVSQDATGVANPNSNTITLQRNNDAVQMPQCKIDQVFCHELVHFILRHMCSDLYSNEQFVEQFSQLLHQFFVTAEYNCDLNNKEVTSSEQNQEI